MKRNGMGLGLRPEKGHSIHATSGRTLARRSPNDIGVSHPELLDLPANTRRWQSVTIQSFEHTGYAYGADIAKMVADPITQSWWDCCQPGLPLARSTPDEWSKRSEEVFHVD